MVRGAFSSLWPDRRTLFIWRDRTGGRSATLLGITEDQTAVDPEGAMHRLVFKFSMLATAAFAMTLPLAGPAFAQESQQARELQELRAKESMYGQQCVGNVDRVAPESGTGVGESASGGQRTQLYRSCLNNGGAVPGSLGYFGRSN